MAEPLSEILAGYPQLLHEKGGGSADFAAHSGIAGGACGSNTPTARVNVEDGLRVDWPDRWFHVRVSQTEPILRVICEQRGCATGQHCSRAVMEQVRELA